MQHLTTLPPKPVGTKNSIRVLKRSQLENNNFTLGIISDFREYLYYYTHQMVGYKLTKVAKTSPKPPHEIKINGRKFFNFGLLLRCIFNLCRKFLKRIFLQNVKSLVGSKCQFISFLSHQMKPLARTFSFAKSWHDPCIATQKELGWAWLEL